MVYPKHQALPPSPHKKVKTFMNMFPYSAANDEMNTTSPSSSSNLSSPSPSQVDTFSIIIEMMRNYNTMLENQRKSIKNLEDGYAKSTAMFINKFDVLLNHVKVLEERIKDIEGKATTNVKNISELGQAVGGFEDTSHILSRHIGSVESRISRIERLIIKSSRKRKRV